MFISIKLRTWWTHPQISGQLRQNKTFSASSKEKVEAEMEAYIKDMEERKYTLKKAERSNVCTGS